MRKFIISLIIITIIAPLYGQIDRNALFQVLKKCSWQDSVKIYQQLAESFLNENPKETILFGKQILILGERYNNQETIIKSYLSLGIGHEYLNDYDVALKYYESAASLAKLEGYKELESEAYNNLSFVFMAKNMYKSALKYQLIALDIRKNLKKDELLIKSYTNILNLYINIGKLDKALIYTKNLLEKYEKLNLTNKIADVYNYFGYIYLKKNKLDLSVEYYLKELKLREELGETDRYSFFLNNIGRIYYQMEKFDKAEEYFKKALEINEDNDDKEGLSITYINLGNVYYVKKQFRKTLDYYLKALEANESLEKQGVKFDYSKLAAKSVLLNNIGLVYKNLDNFRKAREYCQWAVDIKEKINDTKTLFYPLTSLAEIHINLKEYNSAVFQLNKALKLADSSDNLQQKKLAYELLFRAYEKAGKYKDAFTAHVAFTKVQDSLITEQNNKITQDLQQKYESEKKEIENRNLRKMNEIQQKFFFAIVLMIIIILAIVYNRYVHKKKANIELEKRNRQIKQQHRELEYMFSRLQAKEEILRETINTKDKFFSIIAHDLKNPLHAIVLSSDLLKNNFKFMNGEDLVKLIKNINDAGNHLALLLENLLEWARSQSGRIKYEPSTFDLNKVVNDNIELLKNNIDKKNISVHNYIEKQCYIYADYNMINTVIRNLLSNAIKFTEPNGEVKFSASPIENEFLEVTIEDNGIGISDDDLAKLFRIDVKHSTVGTSQEKGTGLGLIVCKEFLNINGGDIKVYSELGKGTKFTFTIPRNSSFQNAINDDIPERLKTINLN